MTAETVFRNARVVLHDDVVEGSVQVVDGVVRDVSPTGAVSATTAGEDLEGDFLLPGLVELHTDHLESHIRPRPGTYWDPVPAVLAHDVQMAGAGATTVFDALRIGKVDGQDDAVDRARSMADAITHALAAGILRADHHLHLRCEVAAPDTVREFEAFDDVAAVRLASLMDHTPGQRQFADVDTFRASMVGRGRVTAAAVDVLVDDRRRIAEQYSAANRAALAERARHRGLTLAAHDDATVEHVEESHRLGVHIAEFPTTEVAARAAHALGQVIVLGAPNIVRGGSQSGNVAAADLLAMGLLDVLSSDYVPASPLQAVFLAVARGVVDLPHAVRLVTANPAAAVGLDDRGRIAPGLRADLVRVRAHREVPDGQHPSGVPVPVVRGVWRTGRRVA